MNVLSFLDECLKGLTRQGKAGGPSQAKISTRSGGHLPKSLLKDVSKRLSDLGLPANDRVKGCKLCVQLSASQLYSWRAAVKYCRAWSELFMDTFPSIFCDHRVTFMEQLEPFFMVLSVGRVATPKVLTNFIKYQTVALFAKFHRQLLPEAPSMQVESKTVVFDRLYPFTGKLRRFLADKIGRQGQHTMVNDRFFNGILQGLKRACETVPEDLVEGSKLGQKDVLSSTKGVTLPWHSVDDIDLKCRQMARSFRPKGFRLREPSTSAAYGTTRSLGGAREALRDYLLFDSPLDLVADPVGSIRLGLEETGGDPKLLEEWAQACRILVSRMEKTHHGALRCSGLSSEILDFANWVRSYDSTGVRTALACPDQLLKMGDEGDSVYCQPLLNEFNLEMQVRQYAKVISLGRSIDEPEFYSANTFDAPRSPDTRPITRAKVEAVLEPLKVRLITKSDAFRQWVGSWFQHEMHSWLKNKRQFRLIGEPCDLSHLYQLRNDLDVLWAPEFKKNPKLKLFWVSGDFKSATDYLKMEATKLQLEPLLDRILRPEDRVFKPLLRDILYEQQIEYKTKIPSTGRGKPRFETVTYKQTTGQLMGSVISFPILCLINFIAYWRALERRFGRPFRPAEVACLINGDDFLSKMDERLYGYWKEETSIMGFRLSLGKNLTLEKYLMINSTLYKEAGDTFVRIPYLNVGLLTGQSKLSGRANVALTPLSGWYRDVIDGSLDRERVHRRFLHYHHDNLLQLTHNGQWNLHLPLSRGGLGFTAFRPADSYVTRFQARYARFIERKTLSEPRQTPPKGLTYTLKNLKLTPKSEPKKRQGFKTFVAVPPVGPLPPNLRRYSDPDPIEPLLGFSKLSFPGDDALHYSPPRLKFLKEFRKGRFRPLNPSALEVPLCLAQVWKGYGSDQ